VSPTPTHAGPSEWSTASLQPWELERPPGLGPCPACAFVIWAPDGRTFATTKVPGQLLAVVDAESDTVTEVSLDGIEALRSLTWSPQSDRLAFVVTAPVGAQGVYVVGLDGSEPTRILSAPTTFSSPTLDPLVFDVSWSPAADHDRLAVTTGTPITHKSPKETGLLQLGVTTMDPDGTQPSELLSTETCYCLNFWPGLVWSPDGRSLAVDTMKKRPPETRPDVGVPVQIRFVKWGGPLRWFPA
jgi:Tol biopolymer transport system component